MLLHDIDSLINYISEQETTVLGSLQHLAKKFAPGAAIGAVGAGAGLGLKFKYDMELLNAHRDVDALKKMIGAGMIGAGIGAVTPALYKGIYRNNIKPSSVVGQKNAQPAITPTVPS